MSADLAPALAQGLALIRFDPDALRALAEEAENLVGSLVPGTLAHEKACSVRNGVRLLVRAAERRQS